MPQNFCTKIESSGRSEALKILFLCMEKILPYFANADFEKKERVCQKYGLVKIKQLSKETFCHVFISSLQIYKRFLQLQIKDCG